MIKPQELRIGNYVIVKNYNSKYWNKIGTIEAFTRNAEYISLDINQNSAFYLKDIQPIPLTEEILLKCGFEKSNDLDKFYHLELLNKWTRIYFNPKHKVCTLSINQHDSLIRIQYLHQLQNLYFALTNEELTIQL